MPSDGGTIYDGARQQFLSLYPNRRQAILRPAGCKGWTTLSKHWLLTDEQIINAVHLREAAIWGCRSGERSEAPVFDIDFASQYHNAEELKRLKKTLSDVGLNAVAYQSSASGGWHIYCPLTETVPSDEINSTLKRWLHACGYVIKNGTLELFPSGNGLRLPLQAGFAWLDEDGVPQVQREDLTGEQAIIRFITDFNAAASDWQRSKKLIEASLESSSACTSERTSTEGMEKLFSVGYRLIKEKYEAGRKFWKDGLIQSGQRHDAILAVEHYLWHGDSATGLPAFPGDWNDEPRAKMLIGWLRAKHNGFCNHINRGNWTTVEAQVHRAVKWRRQISSTERIPYPVTENVVERLMVVSKATNRTWSLDDLRRGNEGREEIARKKIEAAVRQALQEGGKVTCRGLARLSGCSPNTVRRHRDIWFEYAWLPNGSGDKNSFLDLDPLQGAEFSLTVLPDVSSSGHRHEKTYSERSFDPNSDWSEPDLAAGMNLPILPLTLEEIGFPSAEAVSPMPNPVENFQPASEVSPSSGMHFDLLDALKSQKLDSNVLLFPRGTSLEQSLVQQGILPGADLLLDSLKLAQAPIIAMPPSPDVGMPAKPEPPTEQISQGYAPDYSLQIARQKAEAQSHKQFDGQDAKNNDEFLDMFLNGSGNDRQSHTRRGDPILEQFITSPGVQATRDQYSKLGCPATTDKLSYGTKDAFVDTILKPAADSITHGLTDLFDDKHLGSVGTQVGGFRNPPKEYPWATANATRCDADGKANAKGTFVHYEVTNVAGAHSWFLHAVPDRPLGAKGPYRSIIQEFDWIEPIPKQADGKQ